MEATDEVLNGGFLDQELRSLRLPEAMTIREQALRRNRVNCNGQGDEGISKYLCRN